VRYKDYEGYRVKISVGKGEGSKPRGQWSSRHRHQHSRIGTTARVGRAEEGANYARREAYRPALVRPTSPHHHTIWHNPLHRAHGLNIEKYVIHSSDLSSYVRAYHPEILRPLLYIQIVAHLTSANAIIHKSTTKHLSTFRKLSMISLVHVSRGCPGAY
jgi:hypothetical protein